ncbi:hypothetical protein TrCOL_g2998 [Triparma columacea]|uniref:NAD(P)-binding protein n=1 Tax=Triparma columacea TaxID=722753 RepID=A0A9W7FY19_9STRA|nr:hypothetical protein TrCOL_g2998 [Triparma columacea]
MSVRPFGIIVGSSGALGRAYAPILSSSSCINGLYKGLIGLDINPSNDIDGLTKVLALSGTVDDSSIIDPINTITQSEGAIVQAVVHCAGSWAGGPFPTLGSPNASFSSYLTSTSSMLSSNLTSAVFAAGLASRYLPPSGTLVLTGASASLSPSSCSDFMPGYGLSKMGVSNLAEMLREEVEFKVVVVHPGTIDTKVNRDAMPDANFDEWNSTEGIARGVREKIESGEGGDFTVITEGGKTWLEKI